MCLDVSVLCTYVCSHAYCKYTYIQSIIPSNYLTSYYGYFLDIYS